MSAVAAPARLLTAEEFAEFVARSENADRWFELVRGEVMELPPPKKIHGFVSVRVGFLLHAYCEHRGFGYCTADAGFILERDPDTVRGPDVALFEDVKAFADLDPGYGEVPPILVVEVLSPDNKLRDIKQKIKDYLRAKVKVVWLVDPEDRTVTVYRPGQKPIVFNADETLQAVELPGLEIAVADLFRLPGEKPSA